MNLLPSQPPTHTSTTHWREWLLCQDYHLTPQQLHSYYLLKQQANIFFEGPNERWDLIKTLYSQYFGQPAQVKGKEFMRLGFQGQYPETDFRGAGVMGLIIILRFVKGNKELVQHMEQDKAHFFFAITAINICFFMKKYFHLADFLVPNRDKHIYCNRKALKNFCRVIATDQQGFMKFHQLLLKWFYTEKWIQRQKQKPNTLMEFNDLFNDLQNKVRLIFQNYDIQNWEGLQILLRTA